MALVATATFEDPVEASDARQLLASRGIHVALIDHEPGPAYAAVFRPVTLHVPEDEARRASEVLDRLGRSSPETPDARRAMFAALLLFPPLQLYSLWLIARLLPRWRELRSRDRRRVKLAALADLCMLVAASACVLYWWA